MKWYVVLSVSETPEDIARADSDALKSDKLNLLLKKSCQSFKSNWIDLEGCEDHS